MINDKLACDPQGLFFEAYSMENILPEECRSIFLDWALSQSGGGLNDVKTLHQHYAAKNPGHPMNEILQQGMQPVKPQRRKRH